MYSPKTRTLIDLHTHVLPGLDDGPATMVETEKIFEQYERQGFKTVVATPHVGSNESDGWRSKFDESIHATRDVAKAHGIKIVSGSEMRLSPDAALQEIRPIEGTDFVLVDFPAGTWPFYAEEMLFRLQIYGYRPILAHPERYGWKTKQEDIARILVSRGVILQVTLASFTGYFGRTVREASIDLLEGGFVHFLATDAHESGGRLAAAESSQSWIRNKYGDDIFAKLLVRNPSRILLGVDVEPVKVTKRGIRRLVAWMPGTR